jgi:hypothetical protein
LVGTNTDFLRDLRDDFLHGGVVTLTLVLDQGREFATGAGRRPRESEFFWPNSAPARVKRA